MFKKIKFLISGIFCLPLVVFISWAVSAIIITLSNFNNSGIFVFIACLLISLIFSIQLIWKQSRPQFLWWLVGFLLSAFVLLVIIYDFESSMGWSKSDSEDIYYLVEKIEEYSDRNNKYPSSFDQLNLPDAIWMVDYNSQENEFELCRIISGFGGGIAEHRCYYSKSGKIEKR